MTETIQELTDQVTEALDAVEKMPEGDRNRLLDDAKSMINYYIDLTNQVEERRNKFYEFSLLYIAVFVPAIGVFFASMDKFGMIGAWAIGGVLVLQLVFAALSVVFFTFQSRFRYPFIKLPRFGNQWKWFYYGNKAVLEINTNPIRPSKDESHTTIPYLQGLRDFISHYRDETSANEAHSALIQLYLLQVHNYYKNKFYLQLYRISSLSIIFTAAYLFIILIAWILPYACRLR